MQSDSIAIRVENVTQRFRVIRERPDTLRELFTKMFRQQNNVHDFEAIRNVSFHISQGEMVGIIGRNGSGKSTLLKVISGVYKPSTGLVQLRGTIAPLLELGAGFHHELTGRENILINGLLMGFSKREMAQREQSIIDFAEIGDFIDVPVKQYSSGMYMRLAFAVATEVNPDILAVDEILAVGDAPFRQKCFDRLQQFRNNKKTILLVTHSIQQIIDYCDRALLLDKGQLLFDGTPKQAAELYNMAASTPAHEALMDATQPV